MWLSIKEYNTIYVLIMYITNGAREKIEDVVTGIGTCKTQLYKMWRKTCYIRSNMEVWELKGEKEMSCCRNRKLARRFTTPKRIPRITTNKNLFSILKWSNLLRGGGVFVSILVCVDLYCWAINRFDSL